MTDTLSETGTYTVGERLAYTKRNGWTGEATVVTVDSAGRPSLVRFDETSQGWPSHREGVRTEGNWNVESGDRFSRMSSAPVDAPALSPEAADLIRLRADLVTARADLSAARSAHLRDLSTIGEALKETAERHEWCGEYDEEVDNLVPSLSAFGRDTFREAAMVERERDYSVSFTVTLTQTVSVTATGPDEAAEQVSEDVVSYLDRYSASIDDVTIDEVEVE